MSEYQKHPYTKRIQQTVVYNDAMSQEEQLWHVGARPCSQISTSVTQINTGNSKVTNIVTARRATVTQPQNACQTYTA